MDHKVTVRHKNYKMPRKESVKNLCDLEFGKNFYDTQQMHNQ